MSISLPTYTRREMPLLGRRHRVRAIITTGLRREFKRPAVLVVIGIGVGVTIISSIVIVLFAGVFLQGQPLDLSFFFTPASNGAILFFVTLMASVVGSALIADDLQSMALTLYLSRPITEGDYLAAKAAILAPTIPAGILAGPPFNNPAVLYASPWENYLAVARAAFGAPSAPIDWRWSLAILLAATAIAALATYLRMKFVEVVSG